MKKRFFSVLVVFAIVFSMVAPVSYASSESDYLISLNDLTEGIKNYYSDLEAIWFETKVELDTDVYPARLRIIHILDSKDTPVYKGSDVAELCEIRLKNTAYDKGQVKRIEGYDNLELTFPYRNDQSINVMESIFALVWILDCSAVIAGMERGSQAASDTEINDAYDYIRKTLEIKPDEGFTANFFEAGDIKYATAVSRLNEDMRLLKLQAGNKNVSFGLYETRDKILEIAAGL